MNVAEPEAQMSIAGGSLHGELSRKHGPVLAFGRVPMVPKAMKTSPYSQKQPEVVQVPQAWYTLIMVLE